MQAEAAVAGPGGRVLYPGFGRVYGSLGESVVTQWGSANVIWLQVGHILLIQHSPEGNDNGYPLFISHSFFELNGPHTAANGLTLLFDHSLYC